MRILFVAMSSLVDPSSGAAISVRTMMRMLAARGHEVASISAGCFDRGHRATAAEMLRWCKFAETPGKAAWTFQDGPVRHNALPGTSHKRSDRMKEDQDTLKHHAQDIFDAFRPDAVIGYGSTPFDQHMRSYARQSGAKTVFYLANPSYQDGHVFEEIDLILTDTEATAALYRDRLGLNCVVIGKFIEQVAVPRPARANRHVTFVNPCNEKGVTLFYRIAEMMAQTLPSVRFLVVESRATLRNCEEKTGIPFSQMRNIRRLGLQSDMRDVFAMSNVVMMPSLWHESGSRLAVEALSLGIPLVCSDHGGFPNIVGDGGIRIEVPKPLRDNNALIPPPSVAVPWVSAIARLWTDEDFWAEQHAAALTQWENHNPQERVSAVETYLQDLVDG